MTGTSPTSTLHRVQPHQLRLRHQAAALATRQLGPRTARRVDQLVVLTVGVGLALLCIRPASGPLVATVVTLFIAFHAIMVAAYSLLVYGETILNTRRHRPDRAVWFLDHPGTGAAVASTSIRADAVRWGNAGARPRRQKLGEDLGRRLLNHAELRSRPVILTCRSEAVPFYSALDFTHTSDRSLGVRLKATIRIHTMTNPAGSDPDLPRPPA